MLKNLKLIFIHGIALQNTNYSSGLYQKILNTCRNALAAQGKTADEIDTILDAVVQHEIVWANFSTDLTNRYLQLAYPTTPWFWGKLTRPIDPLFIQILQYVKDKGDKLTGLMNILAGVDDEIRRIFAFTDIGQDPAPHEGHHTIIISHSLGTVIAFDYVMGFRKKHHLDPHIVVPSLITMGSPLPLFTSAMGYPDSDLTLPPNVHRWVNIRSPRDGVARSLLPFFRHIPIDEQLVHTRFLPTVAHSAYWNDNATASIIAREVLSALSKKS